MFNPNKAEKDALVAEARDVVRALWTGEEEVRETHACLFHAVALQGVLARRHGVRAMLQAGSCQWPMVAPEDDDGVMATHFSYQWNGLDDPETRFMLMFGKLPELHVWLAITPRDAITPGQVAEDTIIDTTSGSWPERAVAGGFEWRGKLPPDYLWVTANELSKLVEVDYPLGITYHPDVHACMVADKLAGDEIYPKVARYLGFMGGER